MWWMQRGEQLEQEMRTAIGRATLDSAAAEAASHRWKLTQQQVVALTQQLEQEQRDRNVMVERTAQMVERGERLDRECKDLHRQLGEVRLLIIIPAWYILEFRRLVDEEA